MDRGTSDYPSPLRLVTVLGLLSFGIYWFVHGSPGRTHITWEQPGAWYLSHYILLSSCILFAGAVSVDLATGRRIWLLQTGFWMRVAWEGLFPMGHMLFMPVTVDMIVTLGVYYLVTLILPFLLMKTARRRKHLSQEAPQEI